MFELSLEELQNVTVISAGKQTENIIDVPSSVVLITRKEIELIGYRKIENILEDVTGFYIVDDYDGHGQKYGVRGYLDEMPNRKLLILVDGSPGSDELSFGPSYYDVGGACICN